MELRYVYRRIEDAIGTPLTIKESLHSGLTRQLRYSFREARDIAHHTEVNALCLASLSGNKRVDAIDMSTKIADMLDRSLVQAVPYLKNVLESKPQAASKSDYELAFEELAEFTKELNSGAANTKMFNTPDKAIQQ